MKTNTDQHHMCYYWQLLFPGSQHLGGEARTASTLDPQRCGWVNAWKEKKSQKNLDPQGGREDLLDSRCLTAAVNRLLITTVVTEQLIGDGCVTWHSSFRCGFSFPTAWSWSGSSFDDLTSQQLLGDLTHIREAGLKQHLLKRLQMSQQKIPNFAEVNMFTTFWPHI